MPELPLVGDDFAGYRLSAVLGRGGMSVVYQAENPRLGSHVALKVLAPELASDEVFRARFIGESRTAASLNHPNVIPIYDTGSYDGLLYIAMRYVSGTDLRQILRKRRHLQPATALFLCEQAARALDAAHRKGLVHRDVKPGNLLIERISEDEDDPDHVYLADFGITKHAVSRSGLTSTGQFLGTIDYVAPEQIRGKAVTGLADQYSLGCVLYECLTGQVPFEKDLDAAIIWAHVEETPPMPSTLQPGLPPQVDRVFDRVLAKEAADRYRDCREFVAAARDSLGALADAPKVAGAGRGVSDTVTADRPIRDEYPRQIGGPGGGQVQPDAGHVPPGSSRTPVGQSGSGRRSRRTRWLALAAALVVIAAGGVSWALLSGGSGSHTHHMAMSSMSPRPKPTTGALMNAVTLANKSGNAKGDLPASRCKQQTTTQVTCTSPKAGVGGAVFRTYPSLKSLYAAYLARVKALNSGQFQANVNDCEMQQTQGEVSWNHMFHHSTGYSVQQMSSGMLSDSQAAGRVFCNYANGQENMVWTQNDGRLLGWVAGPIHEDVWGWWVAVHHNIGLGNSSMHM